MIPRVLHLYWGNNKPLTYMRYLTVLTFQKLNPDWKVRVHVPAGSCLSTTWSSGEQPCVQYDGPDYLDRLDVCVIPNESLGVPSDMPEVQKSDLLRWYLLGTTQGVWSDFDIIYTHPMRWNEYETWRGAGLCTYEAVPMDPRKFQAIGFLTSEGELGRNFFYSLFLLGQFKIPQTRYQAFGAELLDEFLSIHWKGSAETPFYHDPNVVYYYRYWREVRRYFGPGSLKLPKSDTRLGLHWYAGNPVCAKAEALVTESNFGEYAARFAICAEAKKVLCQ